MTEETEKKKAIKTSNKTDLINQAKKTCLDLGFTAGTEKFGDCTLKVLKMNFRIFIRKMLLKMKNSWILFGSRQKN